MVVSTDRPRLSLVEFAINRDRKWIKVPDAAREAGVSQWASTVSAREILAARCPRLSAEMYPSTSFDDPAERSFGFVELTRGWSVVYRADIESVT